MCEVDAVIVSGRLVTVAELLSSQDKDRVARSRQVDLLSCCHHHFALTHLLPSLVSTMSQRNATAKTSSSAVRPRAANPVAGVFDDLWRLTPAPPAEPSDYKEWLRLFAQAVVSRRC